MEINNEVKWRLLIPVAVVYGIGLFIDIMAVDPSQYALMAMKMMNSGDYLHFYYHNQDYIDKPPMIFWISILSFKLFGVSNFAYKLPSLLFSVLAIYSAYRLAKTFYDEYTGYYTAIILSTCQAWFMINHDVKTDNILAGATIFAIWQLVEFDRTNKRKHVIWAAFGIAVAMLTKGPIGFMVPALAIGADYALKRKWRSFFKWEWILLIAIVAVCLAPMLWGLYTQFDLSRGRETYNGVITSGIQFYFWTQSFGRITGSSTWKDDTDAFFFIHTFLWAFLPWSLFFIVGVFVKVKSLWKNHFRVRRGEELLTLGGTLLPLFVLSLSHYKLPQYIFVFFPLAAILSARLLSIIINENRKTRIYKALRLAQAIVSGLLLFVIFFLCTICFAMSNIVILVMSISGVAAFVYVLFSGKSKFDKLVLPSFVAIVLVNFLLNAHFYPVLLTFQAGSQAGQIANRHGPDYKIISYKLFSDSFEFYAKKPVCTKNTIDEVRSTQAGHPVWVYTDEVGFNELKNAELNFIKVKELVDYPVSRLSLKFLNPETRQEAVSKKYLILI